MKKWQVNQKSELKNFFIKSQKAFTLIELLVVIAMIGIIIMGTNLMSYNNISNKQELETKITQISAQIEEVRNNSLLGKGIGTNLIVPKKYKIDFSTNGSGSINYYYFDGTYKNYDYFNKKIDFSNQFEKISKIKCLKLDGSDGNTLNSTQTGVIIIEGANITLTGNCDSDTKILELDIQRKNESKKIQINTLNGLIKN